MKQIVYYAKHKLRYAFSTFLAYASGNHKKSQITLKNFKNKYIGKRCFVIGNGPSLTPEDLEMLKDEITFASNRIYNMFDSTSWRPTFYAVFDDSIASNPDTHKGANSFKCSAKFLREQGFLNNHHIADACYIHSWYSRKYLEHPSFSTELTNGIFTIATVTYTLIQIARYMGFSEIYLIGVDHKYAIEQKRDGTIVSNQGIRSYFGNQQKYDVSVVAASWEMEDVYRYAENYSRQNGFRIYNATRGGYLEVFERVNLDTIVERT